MRHVSLLIALLTACLLPEGAAWAAGDASLLQARLAEAERLAAWVPILAAVCGGLFVAVALMGWRLWRGTQRKPGSSATPRSVAPPSTQPEAHVSEPPPEVLAEADDDVPAEAALEEHVDLDQQVEFLLVLGQDEEAIDLLLDHLRGTGGTRPGPYLRLMQIYRDRGDEAAYERTRERFNQRFNALAPQWPAERRGLRDLCDYPEVLAELQRVWPVPLDATTTIETLLFRRGDEAERFDLPAYEELLFLYWLARELPRGGDQPARQVDVLLPVDEAQSAVTVIQPARAQCREPAVPVDLDLSTVPAEQDMDTGGTSR
jgi:hypothetical protein